MLLERIDRLDQRMSEQFRELREKLDQLPPRCADHEARLRQVEGAARVRTWESRIYGALAAAAAAIATAFGWKGVNQ